MIVKDLHQLLTREDLAEYFVKIRLIIDLGVILSFHEMAIHETYFIYSPKKLFLPPPSIKTRIPKQPCCAVPEQRFAPSERCTVPVQLTGVSLPFKFV